MTAAERAARTQEADELCQSAFAAALGDRPDTGVALVAVGGYGRAELAPFSDLDVVLVHDPSTDVHDVAQRVWYPLWDANVSLDHSVRALDEVTQAAAADVRVALGLIDARHLAGDTAISLRLRADVLARWRRDARSNLPRLRELERDRAEQVGELAHAAIPDLKASTGGLRDATLLKALVATWLVDVPHVDMERARQDLLDIRDVLQESAGRGTDRVTPESWSALAHGLSLADERDAQRRLREVGRRIAHLSRLTWRRVDRLLAPPARNRSRRPELERIAEGVAVSSGEVVLDRNAQERDPALLLRAAAAAAGRGLVLSPSTAARLARSKAALPDPWPDEARDLLVRLLASGAGLLPVWETLDHTGALDLVLPEWERIRLLPHASPVHRFTVDRHVIETCMEAGAMIRRVGRPDLLLVSALLHDIGKGGTENHSVAGEAVAGRVAARMGFSPDDAAVVARLVRWHLLLSETATSRDLSDPVTIDSVVSRVGDLETLDLLAALTEADAKAASPQAWTTWRSTLVRDLVDRARLGLDTGLAVRFWDDLQPEPEVVDRLTTDPTHVDVKVRPGTDGARVRVTARDRVGLIADVAGTLVHLRITLRSARASTTDDVAVSDWEVAGDAVDAGIFTQRLRAVAASDIDPGARLRGPRPGALPASVLIHPGASQEATVLEVRTEDVPGVVFRSCRALARLRLSVRSAHVTTVGPQALDTFYVQEPDGGPLSDERARSAVQAVRAEMQGDDELPVA